MNNVLAIAGVVVKELYRRKDFYALFILTAALTLTLGSANFFNDDRVVRYLKEICLLLIWISSLAIAIGTAARQIPSERENRTIFPLLAKPVSRWEFLLGKFTGCWAACGLALGVFYLFFGVMTASREHAWPLLHYAQAIWLHWIFLGIVVALLIFGSVVFAAPSSNGTICFLFIAGIMMLGSHLNSFALGMPEPGQTLVYGLYYAIPHLEFFDIRDLITHDLGLVPWWVVGLATLYGLAYSGAFLVAAWLVFRRKSL
jgi:Cu-processing system permease protein